VKGGRDARMECGSAVRMELCESAEMTDAACSSSSIFREFSACSAASQVDAAASAGARKSRLRYSKLKVELGPAVFEDADDDVSARTAALKKKLRWKHAQKEELETAEPESLTFWSASPLNEPRSFGPLSLGTPMSARAAEAAGVKNHVTHPLSARTASHSSPWDPAVPTPRSLKQELAEARSQYHQKSLTGALQNRSRTVSDSDYCAAYAGGGARDCGRLGSVVIASRACSSVEHSDDSLPVAFETAPSGQRFRRTTEQAWQPSPFTSLNCEVDAESVKPPAFTLSARSRSKKKASISFFVRKLKS